MTTYTIRRKGIDANYQPDTFSASTFAEIKHELTRDGTPWRQRWSVHTEDGCVFNEADWQDALMCVERESDITLKLLRECHQESAQ